MSGSVAADAAVDLAVELVRVDSVNPGLVPGAAGETAIAGLLAGRLERSGFAVQMVPAAGTAGRPSLIARHAGTGGGRSLLLNGHLDTVGVAGMVTPFAGSIDGGRESGRLLGRGACDMKGGLAGMVAAAETAAAAGTAGDIVLALVADEEHASIGVQEVLRSVRADAAIVTEPTELEITIAHKGFTWIEIEVTGVAAHGSRPGLGVDAIVKMGPILNGLAELEQRLRDRPHPALGPGSVHASLIEGGRELSTYPDRCVLRLERRTLPGERGDAIEGEIAALLARCRAEDPELVVESRTLLVRDPFEVEDSSEIVQAVLAAATDELGAAPPLIAVPYWADSAMIAAAGIPTVLFGASGTGAHAAEAWVSIPDAVATTRILIAVARKLCT